MTGNDIIDLQLAATESNWRRKGYLEKVFTPAEQELITAATDPDVMVWLLWSGKEAAYKIFNRVSRQRIYAPQKWEVMPLVWQKDQISGSIKGAGASYAFSSKLTAEYIHTVAVVSGINPAVLPVRIMEAAADDACLRHTGFMNHQESLRKEEGLPVVMNRAGHSCIASISHHGRYWSVVRMQQHQGAVSIKSFMAVTSPGFSGSAGRP
ncbi:4-phosphopantetheinyl transferase family protein [Chitinophaga sp. Mgbs1]|uniref:4-phosphopantetheinyl transferase family protein n=1 Tax=Chitinophaga solisilvae TaxID=1233460 RepID=A0A3S1JHD5_9BACT|nr:4-phosphopantetheinyl transferase family protein [Chitinophaga solisilvae]